MTPPAMDGWSHLSDGLRLHLGSACAKTGQELCASEGRFWLLINPQLQFTELYLFLITLRSVPQGGRGKGSAGATARTETDRQTRPTLALLVP